MRCNNTYLLRYAPKGARQQRSKATMRSAHLKCLSKAKVKRRWWSNSTYRLRYWNWQCCVDILPFVSLQQHLPPAVLKLHSIVFAIVHRYKLQQHLPPAVLKRYNIVITLCGTHYSCNSTYRLRYEPKGARRQRSKATMRSTYCLPERREGKTKAIKKCTTGYSIETPTG